MSAEPEDQGRGTAAQALAHAGRDEEAVRRRLAEVPGPLVALLLAGFPAAYLLNSISPWARTFSLESDPAYFFVFVGSLLTLHWLSAGVKLWGLRRGDVRPADVGLVTSPATGARSLRCWS